MVAEQMITDKTFEACLQNTPDWLAQFRKKSWETFSKTSFPHNKEETWRRTKPKHFKLDNAKLVGTKTTIESPKELSGVTSGCWEQALENDTLSKMAKEQLGEVMDTDFNHFTALNAAAFKGGALVDIAKDTPNQEDFTRITHQIHCQEGEISLPRTLIRAERNSNATVMELMKSKGAGVIAPVTEIEVEDGAQLRYVLVTRWDKESKAIPHFHVKVGKDANLQVLIVSVEGDLNKVFVQSELTGTGARSEVLGIVMGHKEEHYDVDIEQFHRVGDTVSDVLFHVALNDKARSVFAGNVLVDPGAQKIDGYQHNRNLLLSDQARADSMPKLEIEANDVRCTHGATFTSHDPNQQFYLQTRGLNHEDAKKLLVTGFFQAVVERIENQKVVDEVLEALYEKLEQAL